MKALSLRIKKLWPMLKFFKVGQRSRSRSHVQNLWLCQKGLVIRYTHAKYESLISYNKKVMANVKVFFSKVGQRSQAQNLWYRWKGLVIRITQAKYERLNTKGKKVMANVKVFDGRTDRAITIRHLPTHTPNMNESLRIKKLWPMLKFLKSRSKVTVKVTHSKFMVPLERPRHKEQTCQIWKLYLVG